MKRTMGTAAVVLILSGLNQTFSTTWYRVQDVGTVGGDFSFAQDINNLGQVVGISKDATGLMKPFLWQNGVITALPDLPGSTEAAHHRINDLGMTAGSSTVGGHGHGYVRNGNVVTDIGTLGGADINVLQMTESGMLLGNSRYTDGHWAAYTWQNGFTKLAIPNECGSNARGYSSNGYLTGQNALSPSGPLHAFLWDNGTVTDLGTLGAAPVQGMDVNSSKQIAGYSNVVGGATHGFFWSKGVMKDIGTLGGSNSAGYDITEAGQVLGYAEVPGGVWHATSWQDNVLTDLNKYINPDGWTLNYVFEHNNAGQLVGAGTISGQTHGFVMTPALAGDANLDGKIDGIDLAMWQVNYDPIGHPTNTWLMGDWNGDNKIDGSDLALWQQNYSPLGYSALFGAEGLSRNFASVPEPATVGLLLAGGPILAFLRRRRVARNGD